MPAVNPVQSANVPFVVQLPSAGEAITVYAVIVEWPLSTGVAQLTQAAPTQAAAVTAVGGCGRPVGTTGSVTYDGAEAPAMLLATTVKVYGVPFTSPVQVPVVPAVTHDPSEGLAVMA